MFFDVGEFFQNITTAFFDLFGLMDFGFLRFSRGLACFLELGFSRIRGRNVLTPKVGRPKGKTAENTGEMNFVLTPLAVFSRVTGVFFECGF
jgi:hypothetical protein